MGDREREEQEWWRRATSDPGYSFRRGLGPNQRHAAGQRYRRGKTRPPRHPILVPAIFLLIVIGIPFVVLLLSGEFR